MQIEILKALEAGSTVVTGSHHLARVLRGEYNAFRKNRDDSGWPAPAVLPRHGWMSALWEDCLTVERPRILLDTWQERVLWQKTISQSEQSPELLQASGTAANVQEAWALATAWRLDISRVETVGNEDSRMFAVWARRFQTRCDDDGLLDRAHLPDFLRAEISRLRLPAAILLAGFDEFTPQQRDFLDACRAAGCAVEIAARQTSRPAEVAVRVAFRDRQRTRRRGTLGADIARAGLRYANRSGVSGSAGTPPPGGPVLPQCSGT